MIIPRLEYLRQVDHWFNTMKTPVLTFTVPVEETQMVTNELTENGYNFETLQINNELTQVNVKRHGTGN